MDKEKLTALLASVRDGLTTVPEALSTLRTLPYEDLGYAKLDHHRGIRKGFPEVVFCQGKTLEQITGIIEKMISHNGVILASRATEEVYQAVKKVCPEAVYHQAARMVVIGEPPLQTATGEILVLSAGTADIPVAEEAAVTAAAMGGTVRRLFDIGVAGIHRLLDNRNQLFTARVIVVVAGMEGALASIVGGLVDKPVIAVPTSVGYGASFGGISALLTMLNSCAPGIAVVNIDNGFGAGYLAATINRLGEDQP